MFETVLHTISPIVAIITALVLGYVARKSINKILVKTAEHLNVDPTNYTLLKNASGFLVFGGALLIMASFIPQLKSVGAGLFASAGIFAAIIGFASQQAFSSQ